MTTPAPGDVLAGRFVVEGPPLGEGLTTTVLPAYDEVAERPVAVKLVHDHLARDPVSLARLRSEAGAASQIRHPNLLVVYGLFTHEGRWLLATERPSGTSLEARGATPLSAQAAIAVALDLVGSLTALHEAGHVHGDVRPGHVFLSDRGAVLLGFGQGMRSSSVSRPGQTAPEVELGASPGVAADVYGLGVVLHYALTSRLPFDGPTPWAILAAQRGDGPAPPPGPTGLARFIVDLMHPMPDRRPPDLGTVRRVLVRLREAPERPERWRSRVAPFRLFGGWAVHGTDPDTGGPAVVRAGLGRKGAFALVRRLREQGWEVDAVRTGLGTRDLAWILAAALAGGAIVPVIGLPVAAWFAALWRSRPVRPRLPVALAGVRATIPPRIEPVGREHAVTAGLLLIAAAILLAVKPVLALVPGVLLAVLVGFAWRARARDRAEEVHRGRLISAFEEVRHELDRHVLETDDALALQGELEVLESDWRTGRVSGDRALDRAEGLRARVTAAPLTVEQDSRTVRDALQRTRTELGEPDTAPS